MSINFNTKLGRYVAQDEYGVVVSIYDPAVHGTLDEFRNAMARSA